VAVQGSLRLVEAHYHPKGEMKRHVRAFIYVAAVLGKESKVADALFKLAEVKEVHVIPGRHDILAVVEVQRKLLEPDAQSIYWFILERIKTIGDVTDTETLIPIVSASKWSD
jgi:DNA-binding Lrp family transcriptional regulator